MFNLQLENGNKLVPSSNEAWNHLLQSIKAKTKHLYNLRCYWPYFYGDKRKFHKMAIIRILAIFKLYVAKDLESNELNLYKDSLLKDLFSELSINHTDNYKMSDLDVDKLLVKAATDLFEFSGLDDEEFEYGGYYDYDQAYMLEDLYQEIVVCILDIVSQGFFNKPLVDDISELNNFPEMKHAYFSYLSTQAMDEQFQSQRNIK